MSRYSRNILHARNLYRQTYVNFLQAYEYFYESILILVWISSGEHLISAAGEHRYLLDTWLMLAALKFIPPKRTDINTFRRDIKQNSDSIQHQFKKNWLYQTPKISIPIDTSHRSVSLSNWRSIADIISASIRFAISSSSSKCNKKNYCA